MTRADRPSPSRRTLLAAAVAVPAIAIPLPPIPASSSHWRAAVEKWRKAEAALAPIARRFNAAETRWFASKDESAAAELERATRDHHRQLDRCDAARRALLNTRAPDLAAVIWKLGVITDWLGLDMPDELAFLPPDLRALQTNHPGQADGGVS
jgi:hypothetical protein